MKKTSFIFFLLTCTIFFFNRGLWNTFFQQDEWNGFGTVIYLSHQPFTSWFHILGSYHFIPFSQFFYFLLYKSFGYHANYFAFTSLLLHAFASFLVYLFAKRLSKNSWVGFLTALIFSINANPAEAYQHLAIFPATVTCFIAILSFMLYLAYLPKKYKFSFKDFAILLGLFLLAVGLREDGLILLLLFPLFLSLFMRDSLNKKNKLFFYCFGGCVSFFLIFRIALQVFTPHVINVSHESYWILYISNLLWFFPKIVFQILINGNNLLIFLWNSVQKIAGAPVSLETILSVFLPATILLGFIFYAGLIILLLFTSKDKRVKRNLYFCIGWVASFTILLATVGRSMDLIEPRYLYLPGFGVSFSLSLLVYMFYQKLKQIKDRKLLWTSSILMGVVVILFIVSSYAYTRTTINVGIYQGKIRKQLIASITKRYPTIPKKTIFYIYCKKTCYRNSEFGISNKTVLPFSSGPGYIILLQYARENEKVYSQFFGKDKSGIEFLWDYGAEGYKEANGYGFGYFITKTKLEAAIRKHHVSPDAVIGLEYDEDTFTLKDVSGKIRDEIANDNEKTF